MDSLTYTFWLPGDPPLRSSAEEPMAVDTETEVLYKADGKSLPLSCYNPRVALASASDGTRTVVIRPEHVGAFLLAHEAAHFGLFNAPFDFWALVQCAPEAAHVLWNAAEENRMVDGCINDQLVRLGLGTGEKGVVDGPLFRHNLAECARDYGSPVIPDKESPYRMQYGALLRYPSWEMLGPEWFDYPAADALATWHVVKKTLAAINTLCEEFHPKFYANALALHGPQTCYLQLRGAIALRKIGFTGMCFDMEKVKALEAKYREKFMETFKYFQENHPDLSKSYKIKSRKGEYKLTAKSATPQFNQNRLREILEEIAKEKGISLPISKGKLGKTSVSVKDWMIHADVHPFLRQWSSLALTAKMLGFFDAFRSKVHEGRLKPEYSEIKKTGRTGAARPNLQNCPRTREFRSCFIPQPGKTMMTVDYSFVELRTLAALCLHQKGRSVLADTIRSGKDPHAMTAALIEDMDYTDYTDLKDEEPSKFKHGRQQAKACFHKDTELLTSVGWKKITDISLEDRVAQYWPGIGKVDFACPLALTTREDQQLLRVYNKSIDLRVTADHRMLGYRDSGSPVVCHPEYMDDLMRGFWNAGIKTDGVLLGALNEARIRELVCIQADGYVTGNQVKFGFKKDRKIQRFREMFPSAIESSYSEGVTNFSIPWLKTYEPLLSRGKVFNIENVLKLTKAMRVVFLDELQYWDSHVDKFGRRLAYSTCVEANANTIQAVAAITGRKTSLSSHHDGNPKHSRVFMVSMKDRDYSRSGNISIDTLEDKHQVFCLSMPSSFVIARDAGKVVCVGNCNFGVPGGLGGKKLSEYAKASYGVSMDVKKALDLKRKLTEEIYPELSTVTGYLSDNRLENLCRNLALPKSIVQNFFKSKRVPASAALLSMEFTLSGTSFRPRRQDWELAADLSSMSTTLAEQYKRNIETRQPSFALSGALFSGVAITPTGRIRSNVRYTQQKNTPFQGLAADGAKIALWRLIKNNYTVSAFIHDEVVLELPEATATTQAKEVEKILNSSMEVALNGLVPSAVEYHLGDCWEK